MPKYPKNHSDMEYHVAGRKTKIAGSTKAVNDFLVLVHEENPKMTINQLKVLITDPSKTSKIRTP